jgi:uncharacterized protein (TIRG00374 family)
MASKIKGKLTLALKIILAVGLIGYLVHAGRLDARGLWALLTWPNIALALLLIGLNTLLAAWRWIFLLQARGFHIPTGYGISLYLIGIFFNYALPGAIGGDVVRGYYLVADHPERRMDSILSIVIDRVLGLYSYFVLTLVAVVWDLEFVLNHKQIRWVALLALLIFLAMTVFFLVVFSVRLSRLFGVGFFARHIAAVDKLVVALRRFGERRRTIVYSVLVSLLAQLVSLAFFYGFAVVSGETAVTWRAVLFAVPMGFLITAVPISPAGIGVGQVAFLYLFQTYMQKQTEFGANAITAFQLTQACWGLVGAWFYLRRRKPAGLSRGSTPEVA